MQGGVFRRGVEILGEVINVAGLHGFAIKKSQVCYYKT